MNKFKETWYRLGLNETWWAFVPFFVVLIAWVVSWFY